jgi:hypothetical protein
MEVKFDIEALRGSPSSVILERSVDATVQPSPYRPRSGELFLKGPIPRLWIVGASKLSGRALHVGLELWYFAGLTRSLLVSLNQSRLTELGVSRDSARRGLRQLEEAGLISVQRHSGRKPIITILLPSFNGSVNRP